MDDYTKAIEIIKNIYWVGVYVKGDTFQCHSYLVVNGNESILIDSGSMLEFDIIKEKIKSIIDLKNIKYIVASHQDPDVCANIPAFEKEINRNDLKIITHSRSAILIKHYGIKSNFYLIDKNNFILNTKKLNFKFITTPYLHSPGAFGTYLVDKKIFFSGDLFGGLEESFHFYAKKNYFEDIKEFHQKYMPSRDILDYSLNKISKLDIDIIAPQHGSIIKKEYIKPLIEELKSLECGEYIEENYIKSLILKKDEVEKINKKLETILDSLKNIIVISTDGKELKYINKAFFKFSKYKNFEEFKKYHNCICELFIDRKGDEFLKPFYKDGKNWIDILKENPQKKFYAVMKNKFDINTIFEVTLKKIDKNEYLASFYDVTIYQENINFVKTLSDAKGIYFTITTLDGKFKFVSNSLVEEFGLKFKPYKYSVKEFLNEKDYQKVIKHIKENINTPYEIVLRHENKRIPVLASGYFMLIDNEPLRLGILIDLREIKRLQKEAKEKDILIMQQAKMAQMGDMVSMIAHQWRQPLNAISAASIKSLIQCEMEMIDKNECIKTQEFIQWKCQELSKIIDTFIKYTEKTEKKDEEFYASEALEKSLNLIKSELIFQKIELHIDIKEDFKIKGDSNILEQILINLLINSKEAFTQNNIKNRKIDIIIEDFKIEVIDNAGGIKDKYKEKIFMPYFTTKLKSGTGIGLYISKKFMREHFNGDICYIPIENGSKFILDFRKKFGGGGVINEWI